MKSVANKRRTAAPRAVTATVVYARVSSDEQRERQTIETQRHFAQSWSDLHQVSVEDWFLDDGVSGTVPLTDRPAGARLLEAASAGLFSQVLVYKLDRLGRDPRHILNAVADLEACGVRVKSMTEPFDTSDPAGRFMLTILSGVAGLERDTIVQRSMAGTERLAHEGAWLGGIVPYGYRVVGKDRDARLEAANDSVAIPGMSEVDVVRMVFDRAATGSSCLAIALHLNELGIPPAYARDGRQVKIGEDDQGGKRTRATAGIWRAGRVRAMLRNSTYRGVHQYGKRSTFFSDVIERPVPALVAPEVWDRAQHTLERNRLFSPRNSRRQYLLRGLIKCGHCGLTYIGLGSLNKRTQEVRTIYRCNGRQQARGVYGLQGSTCPSKPIDGATLENQVWRTIEGFLRQPAALLDELSASLSDQSDAVGRLRADAFQLETGLGNKQHDRDLVVDLYRRGRIKAAELDRQLLRIDDEEAAVRAEIQQLRERADFAEQSTSQLRSTEALLAELATRLDGSPTTFEAKRALVEHLVERITVTTTAVEGKRTGAHADIEVDYLFTAIADRTGKPSARRSATCSDRLRAWSARRRRTTTSWFSTRICASLS